MDSGIIHIPYMRPERTSRQTFDWALENARQADQAGFTEFMVAEHATQKWECIPNPELVIAAAAVQTERIKFAPMAHLLPHHHPAGLAIQVGWLSQILEGRYFLGIGAGAYPQASYLHGIEDIENNPARVRESLEIMEKIWKREPFFQKGQFWSAGYPEEVESAAEHDDHAWKSVVARQVDHLFRIGRGDEAPSPDPQEGAADPLQQQRLVDDHGGGHEDGEDGEVAELERASGVARGATQGDHAYGEEHQREPEADPVLPGVTTRQLHDLEDGQEGAAPRDGGEHCAGEPAPALVFSIGRHARVRRRQTTPGAPRSGRRAAKSPHTCG